MPLKFKITNVNNTLNFSSVTIFAMFPVLFFAEFGPCSLLLYTQRHPFKQEKSAMSANYGTSSEIRSSLRPSEMEH